ncbi:hypothetical protein EIN_328560 [Entamoeba invadens IP1]|uniref:Right handed beta helix domain-containing protein n=1 Tax=Entamoeba invadens IP1 TaxID=370355 RepID=A0A0A1TXT6_ENTIV|nr:hypothetical protein EIN_328560 [Entamoeba invadens IP1]ELP86169.1 hypothetical protein EIN_328560 [Entamoeba invadens IP1]|eukprot:XP_004185515.1 hypothetical protein EIN_328560 [Entamoeba invadens IP1]
MGSYTNPIIVRAALNAKVTFETTNGGYYTLRIANSSNIQVKGPFTLRSGTGYNLDCVNCTNVTVSNFMIYNSTKWAISVTGINIVVSNNFISGCMLITENCTKSFSAQCVKTNAIVPNIPVLSSDVTFENNEIEYSWGMGIDIILCTNCVVRNNYLHDITANAIYIDNAHNVVVEGNRITSSHTMVCGGETHFHAISIGNEDWPPQVLATTNITVRNNFIWGSMFGIAYWGWSTEAYYKDITITHNTLFNLKSAGLAFQAACKVRGKTSNNQFKNNFIYTNYNYYAARVNETDIQFWNISDNVYFAGYNNILKDSWNGTDGNTHSLHFKDNESSPMNFWGGGIYGNCTNESYYKWDVATYCFIPNEKSVLYHNGVLATYTDLDGKILKDYFGCSRSRIYPSIGFAEGVEMCNINGDKYTMVILIVVLVLLFV